MAKRDKWKQAVREMKEHLHLNYSPDIGEDEVIEELLSECGQMPDGSCQLAGTEYCDFSCPFRDEE